MDSETKMYLIILGIVLSLLAVPFVIMALGVVSRLFVNCFLIGFNWL